MHQADIHELQKIAIALSQGRDIDAKRDLDAFIERAQGPQWEQCPSFQLERQSTRRENWNTVTVQVRWRCQLRKGDHYEHSCPDDKKEITWT